MNVLSVIMPVYNEEQTVALALERVLAVDLGEWRKEVIVVNDGSYDQTEKQLAQFRDQILCLEHEENLGKGAAVRTALARVGGDAVVIQDGDLEYDPADWIPMLAALKDSEAAAVFGSRNLRPERQGYRHYVWGAALLTRLTNMLYGSHLTDLYTCYKLVRADALRACALTGQGFELEPEIACKLLKKGLVIVEVPVSYRPRTFREGKKIRFRDGLIGMKTIVRERMRR